MHITYRDGEQQVFPFVLGMNTNRMDAPTRGSMLFDGAGTLRVPRKSTAQHNPSVPERTLYRADWVNPRPEIKLSKIEFKTTHPDILWTVAGVGTIVTLASDEEDD